MKKILFVPVFIMLAYALLYAAYTYDEYTVIDGTTGLEWARCTPGQTYTGDSSVCSGTGTLFWWSEAITACENLDLGGHTDWRLPNVKELTSLIVFNNSSAPRIDEAAFPNTQYANTYYIDEEFYWSSTTVADGAPLAWFVKFGSGPVHYRYKDDTVKPASAAKGYARCVRGPIP